MVNGLKQEVRGGRLPVEGEQELEQVAYRRAHWMGVVFGSLKDEFLLIQYLYI